MYHNVYAYLPCEHIIPSESAGYKDACLHGKPEAQTPKPSSSPVVLQTKLKNYRQILCL